MSLPRIEDMPDPPLSEERPITETEFLGFLDGSFGKPNATDGQHSGWHPRCPEKRFYIPGWDEGNEERDAEREAL